MTKVAKLPQAPVLKPEMPNLPPPALQLPQKQGPAQQKEKVCAIWQRNQPK